MRIEDIIGYMQGGADRWQQIKDKFLEATEREAHDREAWLEQLRAEDPDLWREVASLLAAHAQSDAVLDGVAADYVAAVPCRARGALDRPPHGCLRHHRPARARWHG